jgi:hypothetical protein
MSPGGEQGQNVRRPICAEVRLAGPGSDRGGERAAHDGGRRDIPGPDQYRGAHDGAFGAFFVTQAVLPILRRQGSGHIIQISTIGRRDPASGGVLADLHLGAVVVRVLLVQADPDRPRAAGAVLAVASQPLREHRGLQAEAVATALTLETTNRLNSPPSVVANTIGKAVTARRPKTRYAVGFGARPLIATRRVMPDRAFDTLIRRATGAAR